MNPFFDQIRRNRWTSFMLLSVTVLYSFLFATGHFFDTERATRLERQDTLTAEELRQKEEIVKKKLTEDPVLLGSLSLGFMALLIAGVLIDIVLAKRLLAGRPWLEKHVASPVARWGPKQVFQGLIFLFFAEGCLFLLHLSSAMLTGLRMPEDLLLMISSLLRDIAAAAFILYLVKRSGGRPWADLGMGRANIAGHVRIGLLAYLAAIPVFVFVFTILAVIAGLFSYEPPPQNVVQMYLKPDITPYLMGFTIFVAGLGPVMEEMFFRGFAFGSLRMNLGPVKAAILTSMVFAVFHMSLFAFLPILLMGIFFCYLYEATGSLIPSITAHVVHNTIMVSLTLGFRSLAS